MADYLIEITHSRELTETESKLIENMIWSIVSDIPGSNITLKKIERKEVLVPKC